LSIQVIQAFEIFSIISLVAPAGKKDLKEINKNPILLKLFAWIHI